MPAQDDAQFTAAYSGTKDVYEPPEHFRENALVASKEEYEELHRRSVEDGEAFWREEADRIDWFSDFDTVRDASFEPGDVHVRWYEGGTTNASYNCLDRHLESGNGDKTALIFEPDDPDQQESEHITYRELHRRVCRFANVLKKHGVEKGDRVTIYLPMIPETAVAMLACARIGAIHSVVFAGFSPASLADRITDCDSTYLITADEGRRAGKTVALKDNADAAAERAGILEHLLVVENTGGDVHWREGRDHWLHEALGDVEDDCEPAEMDAEDPLFILYTSGSTGKPKGALHTTAGYLVWTSITHEYVFDLDAENDVYWCAADVGWITGHSYIVYGPLINGTTQVFFEGTPTYPDPSRYWQVVDKHEVTQLYTSPTAIRALIAKGDQFVEGTSRESLRLLGTVGEPINPEAWKWYHEVVGKGERPIVDTWWQTETGGIMITGLPGAVAQKPGSASLPFLGVQPVLLDEDGREQDGAGEGLLAIKDSWPGQMRTVYKNHDRFVETYFSDFEGYYYPGDGCRRDEDGYYWITGRVDDVLNVSGHRIGTAEIESALVSHEHVAEAAAAGFPHDIKGQGIYAYVTLVAGTTKSEALRDELTQHVRTELGPIVTPDFIQFTEALPKTRSGKIMRRVLRQVAADDYDDLGDTSTLADESVVDQLIENRRNRPDSAS
jgi:acetyl-CoA synthetase